MTLFLDITLSNENVFKGKMKGSATFFVSNLFIYLFVFLKHSIKYLLRQNNDNRSGYYEIIRKVSHTIIID